MTSIEQEIRIKLKKEAESILAQQKHLSVEIYHQEVQLESKKH